MSNTPQQLTEIYERRFKDTQEYRGKVWKLLTSHFFNQWIKPNHHVLDLGCGYGEFINNITAEKKWGMDLNPASKGKLNPNVTFLEQDCSKQWNLQGLDLVFTSNFFEHLPNKACLTETLKQAYRALKPGGRLIAMGPNIKYLPDLYWDFFDHHVILSELSLKEALEIEGFQIEACIPKFLPYTMVGGINYPLFLVKLYLSLPIFWGIKGRQFLLIARKPK
jgi:SAM-dependent methyltransferase